MLETFKKKQDFLKALKQSFSSQFEGVSVNQVCSDSIAVAFTCGIHRFLSPFGFVVQLFLFCCSFWQFAVCCNLWQPLYDCLMQKLSPCQTLCSSKGTCTRVWPSLTGRCIFWFKCCRHFLYKLCSTLIWTFLDQNYHYKKTPQKLKFLDWIFIVLNAVRLQERAKVQNHAKNR